MFKLYDIGICRHSNQAKARFRKCDSFNSSNLYSIFVTVFLAYNYITLIRPI